MMILDSELTDNITKQFYANVKWREGKNIYPISDYGHNLFPIQCQLKLTTEEGSKSVQHKFPNSNSQASQKDAIANVIKTH